ncbi:MAG: hypothetical protein Q8J69_13525 [Sphingobacteriaceae bacterium]|nr:hypothetical protein [Sphingobacteriaceae bacterium]
MHNDLMNAATGLFTGIRLAQLPHIDQIKGKKPEDVQQFLEAALQKQAAETAEQEVQAAYSEFTALLAQTADLMNDIKSLDALVAQYKALSEYKEYLFDLLYVAWLSQQEEAGDEDWMESPEWQRIEDKVAERGTEMLHMLMYLQEVRDSEMKATLDDFIEGYLTDDELEFQDDLEVYEELITNRDWLDLTYVEMVAKAEAMEEETAIPELFTPLFCFFKSPEKAQINLLATASAGGKVKRNLPVCLAMLFFYKGIAGIPASLLINSTVA